MAGALSIPSLKSESLIAAQEVNNQQDFMMPLFDHFPRESYDAEELEIRVASINSALGPFTVADGGAHLVRPGTLKRILVKPLYQRPYQRFSNSDMRLYRRWDQILQSGGVPPVELMSAVGQSLGEFTESVSSSGRESMHDMLAGALLGTWTYDIDGVEATVTYGHNDCGATPIAVVWTDSAAPIVTDMYQILDEYLEHAGVPADTIYYNPKAYARYFAGNAEWRTFMVADPQLARAFAGVRQGLDVVDELLQFIDPLFGLNWVPIPGKHLDRDGTSEARWPVKNMTLTTERADLKRVLEHSMSSDMYTPGPTWNWDVFEDDEPKGLYGRWADNGAGSVLIQERVQTIDVEPELD